MKRMPKEKVTVAIEESLVEWVDREARGRWGFRNRSHAFEYALRLMKEKLEKSQKGGF